MLTKASTRAFFFGGTALFAAVFIGLTIHTHTTLAARTNEETLNEAVRRGLAVWGRNNCENCHTLLGEGAYFAPDLTQIVAQRGDRYLAAFLKDPSRFYSEERDGRVMPTLGLSEAEISELIAFLEWVGRIDTNGWPPRPILVSSATPRALVADAGGATSGSAAERGRGLFHGAAICMSCHSTERGVTFVGPSLAGIATAAAQRIADPAYAGTARDAEAYLRESILDPDAFIAPGGPFTLEAGRSLMPALLGRQLSEGQIDDLVAFLRTLE